MQKLRAKKKQNVVKDSQTVVRDGQNEVVVRDSQNLAVVKDGQNEVVVKDSQNETVVRDSQIIESEHVIHEEKRRDKDSLQPSG